MSRRRSRRQMPAEQLGLYQAVRVRPSWTSLPGEVRRQAVRLLIELLRGQRRQEGREHQGKGGSDE